MATRSGIALVLVLLAQPAFLALAGKLDSAESPLDAKHAQAAAETATQAAHVASKVAAHSADITVHAQSALKRAHEAVQRARTDTQGLSDHQRSSLHKAEKKLWRATQAADYGELTSSEHVNMDGLDAKDGQSQNENGGDREVDRRTVANPEDKAPGQAAENPEDKAPAQNKVRTLSGGPSDGSAEAVAADPTRIDVDTEMPYGELEPFGREDTAQELTEASIRESDAMVDQLERAEVSEEKRAVFRALTRLRGAAITSFDGVARSQTGNIDEYNKVHQWRNAHPLHHLADDESDVTKWAFPDNADF